MTNTAAIIDIITRHLTYNYTIMRRLTYMYMPDFPATDLQIILIRVILTTILFKDFIPETNEPN